jgi:pimeloyl-ACP methyl ester carboxylesterase
MNNLVESTLAVPGASLYYQVRGAGPTLLLMSGGHGDANSFDGMVATLAEAPWQTRRRRRPLPRMAMMPRLCSVRWTTARLMSSAPAWGP